MKKILSYLTSHASRLTPYAESGRSLIEMIGVMAIGAVMIAGTFAAYNVISARIQRMEVAEDLKDIAKNSRMLFSARGNYSGISVQYLIRAGALKTDRAPKIATEFNIRSEDEGHAFSINLTGVSFNNCAWLAVQKFEWAHAVYANDFREGATGENCNRGRDNKVSIFVK
ncbi:MAG: hypothetical protein FWG18_04080 [Alphaproteobacteria bacterium]|nr:hypothetical protein [Alphaproteobacteria bacterium]